MSEPESPAERRYRERMALNDVLARAEERTADELRHAAGAATRYAWCFSHGFMHTFDPEAPWCTASWVWLDGATQEAAEADKEQRYGDAGVTTSRPIANAADSGTVLPEGRVGR